MTPTRRPSPDLLGRLPLALARARALSPSARAAPPRYATAPWLECLCAAPVLHAREANDYTLEQLAALPFDRPRAFKVRATPSLLLILLILFIILVLVTYYNPHH